MAVDDALSRVFFFFSFSLPNETELKPTGKERRVFVKEEDSTQAPREQHRCPVEPVRVSTVNLLSRLSSATIKGRDVVRAIPLPGPCLELQIEEENCDAHHRPQPKACLVDVRRKLAGFLIKASKQGKTCSGFETLTH